MIENFSKIHQKKGTNNDRKKWKIFFLLTKAILFIGKVFTVVVTVTSQMHVDTISIWTCEFGFIASIWRWSPHRAESIKKNLVFQLMLLLGCNLSFDLIFRDMEKFQVNKKKGGSL